MRNPYKVFFIIAVTVTLIGTGVLVYYGVHWLLAYFLALNIVTFVFYAYDKGVSHTQAMRIPERVLHTLALIGGSPAALVGQKLFRHKTAKTSFQLVHWIILLTQIALIAWVVYQKYVMS